ncbi:hypothetical protein E4K10_20060 [Streptomyces sp. T1317-0309]|nr:hypothetical protein E4K10_20060 [Streptomyces sp. T1317-0309]
MSTVVERTSRSPLACGAAVIRPPPSSPRPLRGARTPPHDPGFVFFALYLGATLRKPLFSRDGMDDFPVLQNADRATQSGSLPGHRMPRMCARRLCCGPAPRDGPALRRPRHGALAAHGGTRAVRGPFAAVTAVVTAIEYGGAALKPGAVGRGSAAELAVAPLVVLLCGAVGVLLARLYPAWPVVRSSWSWGSPRSWSPPPSPAAGCTG